MSKHAISLSIWAIVFAIAFLGASPAFSYPFMAFSLFLASCLIWICAVDFKAHRIPNSTVLLLALGGVAMLISSEPEIIWNRLLESLIVLIIMSAISTAAKYLSKNQAFGFGDVKLLAAGTLWLGLQGIYAAAFSAFAAGLIFIVIAVLAGKRKLGQPIALGPFIALGIWGAWLFMLT